MKLEKRIMSLILICIIGSCFFVGCSDDENKSKNTAFNELKKEERFDILTGMTRREIKEKLKNPYDAKIIFEEDAIQDLNNEEYEVKGKVKANNTLGATLVNNFNIKLHVDNKEDEDGDYSYKVIDLNISE